MELPEDIEKNAPNPYQPLLEMEDAVEPTTSANQLGGWSWPLVFGLNLPVVLGCAVVVVTDQAWLGVCLGAINIFVLGLVVAKSMPRTMKLIVRGGLVTAMFQFFPLPHLIAGSFALEVCTELGLTVNPNDTIETVNAIDGGLLLTVLTAAPVLLLALFFGYIHQLWMSRKNSRKRSA
ncbi:MAG: hypothetical protein AB8G99_02680 [Planctomycetaceae bacterium]